MSIKKLPNGKYSVDFRPSGRSGPRVRKQFDTQGEAKRFIQYTLSETEEKAWQLTRAELTNEDFEIIGSEFGLGKGCSFISGTKKPAI